MQNSNKYPDTYRHPASRQRTLLYRLTGCALRVFVIATCCFRPITAMAADLQEYTGNASAPPIELQDLHGNSHTLSDYGNRIVMVNFWASWCTPCLQEIPELIRLAEILADRPFTLLAINAGESTDKLPGFVKRMDEHMVVLLDPDSATFKQWGGVALPTTFILDASGSIRYEAFGPVNWDAPYIVEMITQLMDANTSETGKADK